MGLLDRLFRRSNEAEPGEAAPLVAAQCPHTTLTARWDSVDDMGKEEKASSFICTACDEGFSPEEAAQLRASEADRLRRDLA